MTTNYLHRPWDAESKQPRGSAAKESAPSLQFADGRVVLGPQVGRLVVDFAVNKVSPMQHKFLTTIHSRIDTPVSRNEIIYEVYGFKDPTPSMIRDLNRNLHADVGYIRRMLGDELGDTRSGAIRTIKSERDPDTGLAFAHFMGVSSLEVEVHDVLDLSTEQ